MKTDWWSIEFTEGEILLTSNSVIFMCPIANRDDNACNFAICGVCEMEHKWKGRAKIQCTEKCENTCRHQSRNLKMEERPYWVGRNYINGPYSEMRPKGCVCCRKKFVGDYQ